MATLSACQTNHFFLIAFHAFIVGIAWTTQSDWFLQSIEVEFLEGIELQSKEIADESGYLQLFIPNEDFSQGKNVVEDALNNLAISFFQEGKNAWDLFEDESWLFRITVVIKLN